MSNNAKDTMGTGSSSAEKIFKPANNAILDVYFIFYFFKATNTSSMMQCIGLKEEFSNG